MSERLWAPWRDAYVSAPTAPSGCIFCEKPREERDTENYILHRSELAFVVLNAFPYNNGHLMVVPYAHEGDLEKLPPGVAAEIMALACRSVGVLRSCLRPTGFNVGMNLGASAGAGFTDHLHLHVVPRWTGDTNFMAALADVRVLSQSLAASYAILKKGFEERP